MLSLCKKTRNLVLASTTALMLVASTAAAGGVNRITSIDHLEVGDATNVLVRGTRTPTFTVYRLQRPARVVVDISNAKVVSRLAADGKALHPTNTWAVNQVQAHTMYRASGTVVRVTVFMARPGTYNVKAIGHSVRVTVQPRDKAPARGTVVKTIIKRDDAATRRAQAEAARAKRKLAALQARTARMRREVHSAETEAATARRNAREARKRLERARLERAGARKLIATANAERNQVSRSAKQAKAERDRARSAMTQARRESRLAKRKLARALQRLGAANKATIKARADARRAHSEAARARTDAREAQKSASERVRKIAADRDRSVARARADARRAKQRAEVSQRRARAEIARIRREAKAAQAKARTAVAIAKRELSGARTTAREAKRSAARRLDKAMAMMKRARRDMRRAKTMQQRAQAAQAAARRANDRADKRGRVAKRATRVARTRRVEAERASAAASRYRAEARRAKNRRKAAALLARARKAAADAENRMKRARAAARLAERRRHEAESATHLAEARRRKAIAALTAAMRERERAEAASNKALARKRFAIEQRHAAEALRKRAEDAAREAKRRARRAQALRVKEEAALRETIEARENAEQRRVASERGRAKVAASLQAIRMAKQRLVALRNAARTATRRNRTAELAKLRAERRTVRAKLAARRRELTHQRALAGKLDREKRTSVAALARLRKNAARVRRERKAEEKLLAELSARRAAEERRLRRARVALIASRKRAAATSAKARALAASSKIRKRTTLATRVRKVSFVDRSRAARAVIALSSPAKPKIVQRGRRHLVLEIANASIPRRMERTLDTTKFHGPVRAVSSYRNPRDPSKVRVVVELASRTRSKLRRVGNTYYWDFTKRRRARFAKRRPRVARRRPIMRARNLPSPIVSGFGSAATPIRNSTVSQFRRRRRIYRGRKVDLDFKDVDIHDLLRSLARAGDIDFVIPDNISDKVTIKLTRVPWDQALDVILESKGLWYRREGRIYRIAKRETLAAEDKAEADRLRALANREAPEPEVFPLNYADAKAVKKQLEPLLSPKGRIEINKRTNSLIINDLSANRRRITQLVTRLDTQTPQIQIEARIIEARSTYVREIGIQWGGNANASAAGGNATGLVFPNSVSVAGGGEDQQTPTAGVSAVPSNFAVNLPAATGTGAGGAIGLALGSVGGNLNLNLRLSALEDQGTVRIISAPKITVINNVEATISQGVSIPISVISANGVQTQFVPADLQLKVTPKVSNDCYISLDLDITKNEADFVNTGARGDPTILRKQAKTTLLVADGETTVLGGIYTRNTGVSHSKVPFFGDLPVVGWLFRKRRENDERTEVLVFITPKITNKSLFSGARCK